MASVTMGKLPSDHAVAPSNVFGNKSTQMTSIMDHVGNGGKRSPFGGIYTVLPTNLRLIAASETYAYAAALCVDTTHADDIRSCLDQMEAQLHAGTPEQRDLVAKPVRRLRSLSAPVVA